MNWFKENKNDLTLNIYVVPRSSKSEVVGLYGAYLKIKLKSPPVDNAANEELIRFLAQKLKVPKSKIEIVLGQRQKRKTIIVKTLDQKILFYSLLSYQCVP